jgi:hypothetical protein
VFPFQEECFNPSFPLFVTRRVMTPSTLFPRHAFKIRLCQLPPIPNCAFVYLKIHRMALFMNPAQMAVDAKSVTTPTCTATNLHRMTGLSLSTLHRMALFVNPAQMVVDAKSVTTPTCTALSSMVQKNKK